MSETITTTATTTKRHRDAAVDPHLDTTKRHRNHPETTTTTELDPSDFFSNLLDPFLDFTQEPETDTEPGSITGSRPGSEPDPDIIFTFDTKGQSAIDENDEKEKVIRHLLEASDDELGIPSRVDDGVDFAGGGGGGGDGGDVAGEGYGDLLVDGLWEIEDEAANYYTLLQSELFMQ